MAAMPVSRRFTLFVTLVAAVLALTGLSGTPQPAASAPPAAAPGDPNEDEGDADKLREQLAAASRSYLDAAAALEHSQKRQRDLVAELQAVEAEVTVRSATVEEIASTAYRTGRLGTLSALLGAHSPDRLLDRAQTLNAVAANENTKVRELVEARDRVNAARAAIDNEMRQQQVHLAAMAERKKQVEKALASVGGQSSSGPGGSGSGSARPAPRNPDGSWPRESCSVNDPTTSGCLTPRMLHALNQAKAAGFTRYVACFRQASSGEHPKGRACDFAAQADGFGGAATGGDRTYGNNLAAFFVANANRLGVLYVIWYRQIWLPSSGWRRYSGSGSPSAEHTNHVHVSVY